MGYSNNILVIKKCLENIFQIGVLMNRWVNNYAVKVSETVIFYGIIVHIVVSQHSQTYD